MPPNRNDWPWLEGLKTTVPRKKAFFPRNVVATALVDSCSSISMLLMLQNFSVHQLLWKIEPIKRIRIQEHLILDDHSYRTQVVIARFHPSTNPIDLRNFLLSWWLPKVVWDKDILLQNALGHMYDMYPYYHFSILGRFKCENSSCWILLMRGTPRWYHYVVHIIDAFLTTFSSLTQNLHTKQPNKLRITHGV